MMQVLFGNGGSTTDLQTAARIYHAITEANDQRVVIEATEQPWKEAAVGYRDV